MRMYEVGNSLLKMAAVPAVGVGRVQEVDLAPFQIPHGCSHRLRSFRLRCSRERRKRHREERGPRRNHRRNAMYPPLSQNCNDIIKPINV